MANTKVTLEEKDVKKVQDLYDFMKREGLVDLELQDGDLKVSLKRYHKYRDAHLIDPHPARYMAPPAEDISAAVEPADEAALETGDFINTPLMGTFYRSPSPKSEAFVREGETVESGDVLCIVEAMKVMNEIRADKACRIKEILVENGKPVTAGEHLFRIEFL